MLRPSFSAIQTIYVFARIKLLVLNYSYFLHIENVGCNIMFQHLVYREKECFSKRILGGKKKGEGNHRRRVLFCPLVNVDYWKRCYNECKHLNALNGNKHVVGIRVLSDFSRYDVYGLVLQCFHNWDKN